MSGERRPREAYTQCPGCLTIFRVRPESIVAARGWVRCGLCGEVFMAAGRRHRKLPPAAAALQSAVPPRAAPVGDRKSAARPASDATAASPPGVVGGGSAPPHAPGARLRAEWHSAAARELEGAATVRRGRSHWLWFAGCLVLAAALAGHFAWHHRERLVRMPAWRPYVEAACAYLPCALAPRRQPEAVAVVERALHAHPERPGALVFTATVVNRADEAQPWPQLGLRLSAVNGATVGQRWFAPEAYRSEPTGDRLMRPGRRYAVRLMLRDPGARATGFEIDFR